MFIRELVSGLEASQITYAVVGGVAVNLHGVPRMTYDVDIVVATDARTLSACADVLGSLKLVCRLPLRIRELSDRSERERLERERNLTAVTFTDPSNPLREVDVLIGPSVDPDGVAARATTVDAGAFRVRVASIEDLIIMKRRAGRAQDLDDVKHLIRLRPSDV